MHYYYLYKTYNALLFICVFIIMYIFLYIQNIFIYIYNIYKYIHILSTCFIHATQIIHNPLCSSTIKLNLFISAYSWHTSQNKKIQLKHKTKSRDLAETEKSKYYHSSTAKSPNWQQSFTGLKYRPKRVTSYSVLLQWYWWTTIPALQKHWVQQKLVHSQPTMQRYLSTKTINKNNLHWFKTPF